MADDLAEEGVQARGLDTLAPFEVLQYSLWDLHTRRDCFRLRVSED